MTAAMLLQEALKLPLKEREILCDQLQDSLEQTEPLDLELHAEMQRRIQDATEHPENGQTLEEWRAEILATRGLRL
jgi:putative addiction module component (TIGR02574 family)